VNGPERPSSESHSPSPHGWTLDTLEEYLTSKVDALKEYFIAEGRASKEAVSAALAAVKEQSTAAMVAAEKAINKAEMATEKRFDSVNEFRQTLSDQARDFLSRNEYAANHKALEEKVGALGERMSKSETRVVSSKEGMTSIGALLVGAFVVLSAIGNIMSVIFVLAKGH